MKPCRVILILMAVFMIGCASAPQTVITTRKIFPPVPGPSSAVTSALQKTTVSISAVTSIPLAWSSDDGDWTGLEGSDDLQHWTEDVLFPRWTLVTNAPEIRGGILVNVSDGYVEAFDFQATVTTTNQHRFWRAFTR